MAILMMGGWRRQMHIDEVRPTQLVSSSGSWILSRTPIDASHVLPLQPTLTPS
jgi:hypothetical protein